MLNADLSMSDFTFRPLTPETWDDFETLFREHGVQNGCWCMFWRATRAECQRNYGEGNRLALRAVVDGGGVPGLVAYHGGAAVGWVAIAPRADHPTLDRSPKLRRIDDRPVWSITCFYISRGLRGRGLSEVLAHAAIEYAAARGATVVEAYPLRDEVADVLPFDQYMGFATTFERVGFRLAADPGGRRQIWRYETQMRES